MGTVSLDQLGRDDFARNLGSEVRLCDDPACVLTLAEVSTVLRSGEWESFSVILRGTPGLGQGTYDLDHATLGSLALFVVPIEPDTDGARYEAVFNRRCSEPGG